VLFVVKNIELGIINKEAVSAGINNKLFFFPYFPGFCFPFNLYNTYPNPISR
jgi:hypothetical protein